jgi:hypothetical protein
MNLDERLRHAAEDIRAAAADTPVPSLDHETVHHGPQALRVGVIAAAGVLAVGGLAVVYNESSSSPDRTTATQPADELAEARGRWDRAALPGYYLSMDGKIDTVGAHVELLVDDGSVTSLNGSPDHEALTVIGLFDLLEGVGNSDDDAVISFHESLGYPTRIRVQTDSVDLDLTVRDFQRFERPQDCPSEPGSPTDLDAEPAEWLLYGQYTRWSDTAGCPVRIDVISQVDGPEHCDWQGADFLTVGRPIGTSFEDDRRANTYVWDPDDRLADVDDVDRGQHIDIRDLPSTAVDTGYRLDGVELWLDDQNRDVAYRVDGSNVEVLVRDATHRLLCL